MKKTTLLLITIAFFAACAEKSEGMKSENDSHSEAKEKTSEASEVRTESQLISDSIKKANGVLSAEETFAKLDANREYAALNDEIGFTPIDEYNSFIPFETYIYEVTTHFPDLLTNGEPDFSSQTKVCYFTPPYNKNKFAFVQTNFINGTDFEIGYFFYYPNTEGKLDTQGYRFLDKSDSPCDDCQLLDVEVRGDRVYGIFKTRQGDFSKTLEKEMVYDLSEMTVYWID